VRDTREFKALGTDSFRIAAARKLRDEAYSRRGIAFLHEASRKIFDKAVKHSRHRAAIGQIDGVAVVGLAPIATALGGFGAMAAGYVSRRIGQEIWTAFLDDLEAKRSLSLSPKAEWS
jgi:hypothetical protein